MQEVVPKVDFLLLTQRILFGRMGVYVSRRKEGA